MALAIPLLLLAAAPSSALDGGTCLTPSLADPAFAAEVARLRAQARPRAGDPPWFTHISPSGLFEMHYQTEGLNKVQPADVDPPNGIPDLVEDCAVWAETCWTVEVHELDYPEPPLPADGTYDIRFLWFGNPYTLGACGPVPEEGPDHTEIWLRHRFQGGVLPPGVSDELAPPTIAHEVKHATQYLVNHWAGEVGWIELDASWAPDRVFDELVTAPTGEGNQLSNPEQSLDEGGYGYYEDWLWEQYLFEKHGNRILLDMWDHRDAFPSDPFLDAYGGALELHGESWDTAYSEYMEWCWLAGSRAVPGLGFEEAADFIDAALRESPVSIYPHAAADSVAHLACHHRKLEPGHAARTPRILFDGDGAAAGLTVSVILHEPTGVPTVVRLGLDAGGEADWLAPEAWGALSYLGITVTNAAPSGPVATYSLEVLEEATTGIGPPLAAGRELLVRPNPFRSVTEVHIRGVANGRASVTVHDVRGRVVRTLASGRFDGDARLEWDGRAASGRPVPAGVYWIRLATADGSAARSVTRLR